MKKSILLTMISGFSLLAACHKEREAIYLTTDDFFTKNQSPSQLFSFTNGTGAVIQTSRGAKIHFPANAFAGSDNAIINGQVNIAVKEILTPMEMIFNKMTSTSFDGPLVSGGEYFIGATANNKEVKLAKGKKIQIELPSLGVNMDAMKVYNGYIWADDTTNEKNRQTWTTGNDSANTVGQTAVSAYSMFCDSVKWINCDRLLKGTRINCSVSAGNAPSVTETRVFVHYTGQNSVIQLYRYGSSTSFTTALVDGPVTVVGICVKNGKLYASVTKESLQDSRSYPMNFSETDENSLKATLSALK